jgi:hypothetical protein
MYRITVDQMAAQILALDNTPNNQATYSTDQVIQWMDTEMRSAVVPLTIQAMEEFCIIVYPYNVDSTTLRLDIPGEAAGFRVRDLYLFDPGTGNFAAKAKRINSDSIPYMANGLYFPVFLTSMLPQYYIENNSIIFYPQLTEPFLAKLRIFKGPNHLYAYNRCAGQVTALLGSNQVTVDNIPTASNGNNPVYDWTQTTGPNPTTIDIIQSDSPYNFRYYTNPGPLPLTAPTNTPQQYPLVQQPIVAIDVATNTLTLNDNSYNNIQLGDFIVSTDTCPFIQFLPFEAYNLIELRASMKILKAQADLVNLGITGQLYNAAANDYLNLITPKVENMPKKIGGGNRGGLIGNLGLRRGT